MKTSRSERAGLDYAEAGPGDGSKLGISLSGGGIRSAAFSLGVCQRLIEAGKLVEANYLSAVSGGGYIAAGMAISDAEASAQAKRAEPPPWGRGSPEEEALRRNLSYLAPGVRGRLWLLANVLYGLVLNLIPLVLGAYLCGRLAGHLLVLPYPGLAADEGPALTALPGALVVAVGLVAGSAVVVGIRRFSDWGEPPRRRRAHASELAVAALLIAAAVVFAFGCVLPALLALLTQVTASEAGDFGLGVVSFVPRRIVVGLVIVSASVGLGAVAVWMLRRRRLPWIRGVLAYLAGAGVLLAPFMLGAQTGSAQGSLRWEDLLLLGTLGLIVLAFSVFVHNRRYSMHHLYRERLHDAFALRRVPGRHPGQFEVERIPYSQSILLSQVSSRNRRDTEGDDAPFPRLVMCAAVAARGAEVPNKSWAADFSFEGERSGSESMGISAATPDLESGDWIGGGDVTLPAMMAISGAAVSPLMGRFTLPGFRFLMAMLNIRLGVWLRNPGRAKPEKDPEATRLLRMWRYLVRGWWEPGAWYVLKEGLGLASARGRYIYVSDGGHWENLGLTELLRRRCVNLVVVDASGDPGLGDISRAISVARAELGVEFSNFDLECIKAEKGELAAAPMAIGTVTYPDGDEATIYYARCVLWEDAPSDLRLLAQREHLFPNHPTSNQFFSGELFDAYRALGWAVGGHIVSELEQLPPWLK